jgi:hypothetical protein
MAGESKPKAAGKRKRRRRAPRAEYVDYVVEIESWDWSYWLALNMERHPLDPYHEHRHLQIKGRLLRPTGHGWLTRICIRDSPGSGTAAAVGPYD